MRRQNSIDSLIKGTSEEYNRRIESEKARKEMALKYMEKHEQEVRKRFEQFRDDMNK